MRENKTTAHWLIAITLTCSITLTVSLGARLASPFSQQPDAARIEALRQQARAALSQTSGEISVAGLERPVEILRDTWGVAHIYAKSQHDLFFAQGFVAAQDRLWQLDIWRRQAEGKLAEVLGPSAVERDRVARLLRFRGDWNAEWRSYSPDTRESVTAFTDGINAYIAQVTSSGKLPIEFQLLNIKPEAWTPEVCVSRMAAYSMTGNASNEILRADAVQRLGVELANKLLPADPPHTIQPSPSFSLEGISDAVLA
ncbi:MAG: penicillin acylase family protein, partial [Burkholderiales bacterium]